MFLPSFNSFGINVLSCVFWCGKALSGEECNKSRTHEVSPDARAFSRFTSLRHKQLVSVAAKAVILCRKWTELQMLAFRQSLRWTGNLAFYWRHRSFSCHPCMLASCVNPMQHVFPVSMSWTKWLFRRKPTCPNRFSCLSLVCRRRKIEEQALDLFFDGQRIRSGRRLASTHLVYLSQRLEDENALRSK